jgi:hypothetical protein
MLKPNIKYRVTLTEEERGTLKKLTQKGHTAGYRIRHTRILLALDEIPANCFWTDRMIAVAYGSNMRSIGNLRKRFVEQGFEAALDRKKRLAPPVIKVDGETEAKIILPAPCVPYIKTVILLRHMNNLHQIQQLMPCIHF